MRPFSSNFPSGDWERDVLIYPGFPRGMSTLIKPWGCRGALWGRTLPIPPAHQGPAEPLSRAGSQGEAGILPKALLCYKAFVAIAMRKLMTFLLFSTLKQGEWVCKRTTCLCHKFIVKPGGFALPPLKEAVSCSLIWKQTTTCFYVLCAWLTRCHFQSFSPGATVLCFGLHAWPMSWNANHCWKFWLIWNEFQPEMW